MTPFDILRNITQEKKDLYDGKQDEFIDSKYESYLINYGLSYFADCILYANEINTHNHLPKKLQYHYFLNTIRPAKRYSKWAKKDNGDDLNVVMEYYKCNIKRAKEALSILSKEQISIIKQKLEKGG